MIQMTPHLGRLSTANGKFFAILFFLSKVRSILIGLWTIHLDFTNQQKSLLRLTRDNINLSITNKFT